jgi:hypothetical protein
MSRATHCRPTDLTSAQAMTVAGTVKRVMREAEIASPSTCEEEEPDKETRK